MVNVKNLFGMAVMATALVGCSSNDNLAPDGKDNAGKAGEAYASFKINLPTTTGTGTRGEGIQRKVHLHLRMVTRMSMLLRTQLFFSSRKMPLVILYSRNL